MRIEQLHWSAGDGWSRSLPGELADSAQAVFVFGSVAAVLTAAAAAACWVPARRAARVDPLEALLAE